MNEFIIWDNTLKTFLDKDFEQNEKIKNDSTYLFEGDEYYPICKMDFIFNDVLNEYKDRLIAFYNIGLKDINGKNIYADSSIVELEWLIFRNHEPVVVSRLKGFFSKDKRLLNYKIMILENNTNYSLNYGLDYAFYNSSEARPKIINIKIIDTIQENKLGLIKA